MKKSPLPVDTRGSKTSLFKFPIIDSFVNEIILGVGVKNWKEVQFKEALNLRCL